PGLADDLAGGGLIGLVESADGPVGQGQRGLVTGVVDLRLFEFVEAAGVRESAQGRVDGLFHGGLVQGVELICHLCPSVRVVWTECLFMSVYRLRQSPLGRCPRDEWCRLGEVCAAESAWWVRLGGWGPPRCGRGHMSRFDCAVVSG